MQLINQSRFLLEIRYWILSSNKSFIINEPLVSCPISVFCFDLFMSCTHPKWMNGIGQMTKGAFRINDFLWNPYFRWSTMESQHFENLLLYHQVWTQKETCYCVEIIKIPWLPSNLYLYFTNPRCVRDLTFNYLSPLILRTQLRDPQFYRNYEHFQSYISWLCFDFRWCIIENHHDFDRTEDRTTVFLEWTDFNFDIKIVQFDVNTLITNLL